MKVKPPSERAVTGARRALVLADVRGPGDIVMEAIARRLGVRVVYESLSTAVATLVCSGERGVVCIDERLRDTPRGDFTLAHEIGHFDLHRPIDHRSRCTASPGDPGADAGGVEAEADQFGAELRMPEAYAAPLCAGDRLGLGDVERVARVFRASFEAAGIRAVELARAACAFARVTPHGRVKWAVESPYFSGTISKGRKVDARSLAARLVGRRAGGPDAALAVDGAAWGAREPLREHAISLGPRLGVLTWIVPES